IMISLALIGFVSALWDIKGDVFNYFVLVLATTFSGLMFFSLFVSPFVLKPVRVFPSRKKTAKVSIRNEDCFREFVLLNRDINVGFSGGEKKRFDIMHLSMLNPDLIILDEIDSGLDIDALKLVSSAINDLKDGKKAFLIITHYQRLLNYIKPDHVHIMDKGKIVASGGYEMSDVLEKQGYSAFAK
ncbi:MAG: hypothetical protein KR126chlam6_01178, partial [Candidatus Anoxychlamydiales bacterium]|nr:hypothetical protein [Candidatus Anoxychlamydiales bacterium]